MGYMHIDNAYKVPDIFLFKELYALEKVHGTSAHVGYRSSLDPNSPERDEVYFFSGGEKRDNFLALFDQADLLRCFRECVGSESSAIVYGEAYGGRRQGMKDTYGEKLRFVAFDVKIGDSWLNVPDAADVCGKLGLEFVDYKLVPATKGALDAERDRESVQAIRNGCGPGKLREGVVLRPVKELVRKNGSRLIAKHKRPEFMETKKPREIDAAQLQVLQDAEAIAEEWVTAERVRHVMDKLRAERNQDATKLALEVLTPTDTGEIVRRVMDDVRREGEGEITWSREAERSVGSKAAKTFKAILFELPETAR